MVVLAVTLGGCGWFPSGPVMLGDSISVVAAGELRGRVPGLELSAALGATVADMYPAARSAASSGPRRVVIELGSNDALHGVPVERTRSDLARMLGLFDRAGCIRLVTVSTRMVREGSSRTAAAQQVNAVLGDVAAADPRVRLVDWDALVRADLDAHGGRATLTGDTVHPTPAGSAALAAAVGDALDSCPPR